MSNTLGRAADSIAALLDRYGALLREVDAWFRRCLEQHSDKISCRNGCSACCRGLFDITLLDAMYLKQGFDRLHGRQKQPILQEAAARLESLSRINPEFREPWLLNGIPEVEWELLMPEDDETPCLLLSENGGCLVYDYRPMTCRLNGIPLIDVSGEELFDEWCTMNFTGQDPRNFADLRFGFTDLFARELQLFQELTYNMSGTQYNEIDMFIPAAIVMNLDRIVSSLDKSMVANNNKSSLALDDRRR
jgi:Fe-S-cluster containining protein